MQALVRSPTITVTLVDLVTLTHSVVEFGCLAGMLSRPKTWFADRINLRPGTNVKGFASETHSAAEVLDMCMQVVVKPQGILQDETEALECLCDVFLLLRRADARQAGLAFNRLQRHHELVMSLWPGVAKPKLHYSMHAILSWLIFGVFVTRSGTESEHKTPKRVMHIVYNKCCQTAMQYWMRGFMEHVTEFKTYSTMCLNKLRHRLAAGSRLCSGNSDREWHLPCKLFCLLDRRRQLFCWSRTLIL